MRSSASSSPLLVSKYITATTQYILTTSTGAPPKTVARVPKVIDEIVSKHSSIKEWGVVGFCWGGKIVNLTSQSGTKFKAAAAAHPAMVDPEDAPGVTIPYLMLPSKDEDKEAVEKWEKGLKVRIQSFSSQRISGLMIDLLLRSRDKSTGSMTRSTVSWLHAVTSRTSMLRSSTRRLTACFLLSSTRTCKSCFELALDGPARSMLVSV